MVPTYFLNDFEMVPVDPTITGITFVFIFIIIIISSSSSSSSSSSNSSSSIEFGSYYMALGTAKFNIWLFPS
jgi:hypothetical protein